jgi:AGCS family alanine or glycine:cation symporter
VLAFRFQTLPSTFGLIFKGAFTPNAIIGGTLGSALKKAVTQGVKRGLFSNEAGMGSTPHAHALADTATPHEQGVIAMVGVFIDTFLVLTMTALVVISTMYIDGPLMSGNPAEIDKANMAQLAFGHVFGTTGGNVFVAVCLMFFAFSTIIGWNLFGKINVEYLWGKKATRIYSALTLVFIFLGSCLSNDLVWELADLFNQLMVLPNVLALIALSGIVVKSAAGKKE